MATSPGSQVRSEGTDSDGVSPRPELRARSVRRVLWWTLGLNLVVALLKMGYGTWADALAIRADGFHSLTDSANNVVGLVSLSFAARPPDDEHPYGHHKLEVMASALVGASLLVMAYDVVQEAVARLVGADADLPRIDVGAYVVLGVTLTINVIVAAYERRAAKRLQSSFLESDATHTLSDVFVSLGVTGAAALVHAGYPMADLLGAAAVAAFVGWAGVSVLRHNLGLLSDTVQIDPERIEALVLRVPGVAGAHKIRSRGAPGALFVDLHIQIAPHLDVVRAHRVTHEVIDAVKGGIDGVVDVLVHTEPAAEGRPYVPLPD